MPSTASVPVLREIKWSALISQIVAIAGAIGIGFWLTGSSLGAYWGAAAYLIYSIGSKLWIARAHRRGIRLTRAHQYEAAIPAFKESYDFFVRNEWIDRWRAIVLLSPSAISYREMALCNIAFCYSQIGDGKKAEAYYGQALMEFPNCGLASAALRLMESVKPREAEGKSEQSAAG